ncbi:Disulfide bond formation protein B [Frankliniella fusca]|uniref:Disulfide bond formation protein B n=1 Tax=Frankliniella fusca TaxID=407009 RepID=A0AAE1LQL9_9NEOP|nr:Disulfide bond formation protein B [Frankliniella fusca]
MADGKRALVYWILLFFLSVGIMGGAIFQFIIKPKSALEDATTDPGLGFPHLHLTPNPVAPVVPEKGDSPLPTVTPATKDIVAVLEVTAVVLEATAVSLRHGRGPNPGPA